MVVRQGFWGRAALVGGLLVACAGWAGPGAALQEAPEPAAVEAAPDDLSALLEPFRAQGELPALAAVVVSSGGIVAGGATGTWSTADAERVTLEDRFHLGSCTKSMTATLAAILVEDGVVAWETTLGEVFADVEMRPAWRAVTLAQLLAHTSGAPRDLGAFDWLDMWVRVAPDGLEAKRLRILTSVVAIEPEYEPGSEARYSNIGVTLAGALLEARTGRAFEALLEEEVFGPLGMATAGFGAPDPAQGPQGHNAAGKPMGALDNPPAIAPAGTAHASLPDWAKYVQAHLAGLRRARGLVPGLALPAFDAAPTPAERRALFAGLEANVGGLPLSDASWAALHAIQPKTAALGGYSLGWMEVARAWSTGPIATHSGSNTMWYCVVWMAPDEDFALLIATNQGGPRAAGVCDQVAGALIEWHGARRAPEPAGE